MNRLGITNYALGALGHRRISDINEVSDVGERTRFAYAQMISEVIEMYDWPYFIARVALAATTVPSTAPYKYSYASPNDMIKPYKLSTDDLYLFEGDVFYTDNIAPVLVYLKVPADGQDIPHPLFCKAAAYNMAQLLATDLLANDQKASEMEKKFGQYLFMARDQAGKESKQRDWGLEYMYPDTGTPNL